MKVAPILLLALFISACSSSPPRHVFSDFLEVREVVDEDPLAARFADADGEVHHLGDPILKGKNISRLQVKPGKEDDLYDLYMTLTGALDARWRRFARSRGRTAALVIDGTIVRTFPVEDPGMPVENEILVVNVPGVAESQVEAERLDRFFQESKAAVKKKRDRE